MSKFLVPQPSRSQLIKLQSMLPQCDNSRIVALKISNFSPRFSKHKSQRYSEEQRLFMRRNIVQSSLSPRRSSYRSVDHDERNATTSQHSRFSMYVEREVSKIHQGHSFIDDFQPVVRDKIKQLREVIQQKARALRNSPIKHPEKYCFREYKIKSNQDVRKFSFTLHSLRNTESPLMKAYEKSKQLLGLKPNIEVQEENKEKRNGKIVLIGGSISKRNTSPASKQSSRLQPAELGKTHYRYFLRQTRQSRSLQVAEDIPENDCRPWQIHKLEHLEEEGHLNYL